MQEGKVSKKVLYFSEPKEKTFALKLIIHFYQNNTIMAKIILLTLALFAGQPAFTPLFAAQGTSLEIKNLDECTAPAPDSFRITSIGSDFISLAWLPAWVGATHTLAVLEEDGAGGWVSIDTIYNVSGSSYTVNGLISGITYRFIISTNCPNGETSSFKAIIDGITLILDLTIDGRIPNNPVATICSKIPLSNRWTGFKVEYVSAGISIANFFEFVITDANITGNIAFSRAEIRRAFRDHPIVAIDQFGKWPICADPKRLEVNIPFQLIRLFGNGPAHENIGWVNFFQNSNSISICPVYNDPDLPWNNAYTLTALVAQTAFALPECEERFANNLLLYADLKIQSPFDEILRVFSPNTFSSTEKATLRLLNIKGQTIMEQQVEFINSEITLPISNLVPGVYFLQIKSENETQILKAIKS